MMRLAGARLLRRHSATQAATATQAAAAAVAVPPPRGVDRVRSEFSAGDELHGFRVEKVEELPQFEATAVELVHTHTGARWLHLAADDTNNCFNVAFRTAPKDSTGVAHILEHTVLCTRNALEPLLRLDSSLGPVSPRGGRPATHPAAAQAARSGSPSATRSSTC